MFKVFGKLRKSKSLPPSDDQVRKHKDQRKQRDNWRRDVAALSTILNDLKKEYERHKGDFALSRYEELKDMIKRAIAQFQEAVKENSNHRCSGKTGSSGTVCSLRANAASFAKQQETLSSEERHYAELSAKEIENEIRDDRKEIIELKEEFRKHKQSLEKLSAEYEESKKLNPATRYTALKEMIKDVLSASVL